MDIPEKLTYLRIVIDKINDEIIMDVVKMPKKWRGIELRWYIEDKFRLSHGSEPRPKDQSKRYKTYRRAMIARGF